MFRLIYKDTLEALKVIEGETLTTFQEGWQRDLLRECVEPNPGPKGMMVFFDEIANGFENKQVARDALANLEHTIRNTPTITAGALGYTDADVRRFFTNKTPAETKALYNVSMDIADPIDEEVRSRLSLSQAPSVVPQNATAAQKVTRQEYRKTLRKKFPAPSSYSKAAEGWGTFQNTVAIACHKPFGFDGTPVVLLNSVLGELYTNLNGDYEPSRDDCRFAQKLMEVMAHPFTKEEDLRDQFVLWMQDSLGWQLQRYTMDGSISDATLEVSVNHLSDARVMIMNKEDKLAKGEGRGDAYMQNIGYYTKYWASAHEQIFTRCVCPSILLEQAGHEISISGCVFAEKIICDPFLVVNILPVLHDATHRIRVARMVGSLRCAITGLINFYNKIPVTSVFDPFPQFREFKFRGEDMKITYVEQIKGLVYKATAANSNENTKDIIVKFCHSYSEEAHRICAEEGAAPELLFIDRCSYFQVVVMDFITNSKTLYDLDDSIAAEVKDKVQVVVNKLHQHNIVHGDLRANNILVKTEGNNQKIYLIDFDWAGIANQSTYPFFMNHEDIKWPHGINY